ncbi:MAG: hypothetical protein JEZ14_12675 [Marinilabiliaceae bacterium]|nr:hypothetical protein [Marinilabiliaceae bacterium]
MGLSGHQKTLKKHLFSQTGHRDKFPDERDNRPGDWDKRPGERDKNTSDRDVYPADDFTLTGDRDENTRLTWTSQKGITKTYHKGTISE